MLRVLYALLSATLFSISSSEAQIGLLDRQISAPIPVQFEGGQTFGMKSRLASISRVAGVLTGFEEALHSSPGGGVSLATDLNGKTVRQALDILVRIDQRYEWREMDGVVVMRSKTAWGDCSHYLHRQVSSEEEGLSISATPSALLHLVDPTFRQRAIRSETISEMQLKLKRGATLLEVINALAVVGQLSWSMAYGTVEGDRRWIEVSLEALGGSRVGLGAMLRTIGAACQ